MSLIISQVVFVRCLESNKTLFDSHVNASMVVFPVVIDHTCLRCFGKKGSQHSCLETQSKEANICASIMEIQTIFIK